MLVFFRNHQSKINNIYCPCWYYIKLLVLLLTVKFLLILSNNKLILLDILLHILSTEMHDNDGFSINVLLHLQLQCFHASHKSNLPGLRYEIWHFYKIQFNHYNLTLWIKIKKCLVQKSFRYENQILNKLKISKKKLKISKKNNSVILSKTPLANSLGNHSLSKARIKEDG